VNVKIESRQGCTINCNRGGGGRFADPNCGNEYSLKVRVTNGGGGGARVKGPWKGSTFTQYVSFSEGEKNWGETVGNERYNRKMITSEESSLKTRGGVTVRRTSFPRLPNGSRGPAKRKRYAQTGDELARQARPKICKRHGS